MRQMTEVEVGERRITVRELSVGDVRVWLKELEAVPEKIDLVGEGLIDGVSLADIARMTDLKVSDMDALAPSEIAALGVACRQVNVDFFGFRDRLVRVGADLAARQANTG